MTRWHLGQLLAPCPARAGPFLTGGPPCPAIRGRCSRIVNRVVRSTRVPIAELPSPRIKSPSQCPGTARSSASAGRSRIMISGLTNFWPRPRVRALGTRSARPVHSVPRGLASGRSASNDPRNRPGAVICSGLHELAQRRVCRCPCRRLIQRTSGPGTLIPSAAVMTPASRSCTYWRLLFAATTFGRWRAGGVPLGRCGSILQVATAGRSVPIAVIVRQDIGDDVRCEQHERVRAFGKRQIAPRKPSVPPFSRNQPGAQVDNPPTLPITPPHRRDPATEDVQLALTLALPSQLLTFEMLRRPIEFTQYAANDYQSLLAHGALLVV